MKKPYVIDFSKIGSGQIGFISVFENCQILPFEVERIFWTYFTPEDVVRGRHAHYKTEQILVAVAGRIIVNIEIPDGEQEVFILDKPNIGLYIPPNCWHTMQYSHSSVQLALANTVFDENDYIRSYEDFKTYYSTK
jgi:mannose-6-phosphate isomerase-like protein (cupin superfamily)